MELDFDHIRNMIEDELDAHDGQYDLDMLSWALLKLVDEKKLNIYEATQYLLDTEGSEELLFLFTDNPQFMWWFPDGMIKAIWDVPGVKDIAFKYWEDMYGGQYEHED